MTDDTGPDAIGPEDGPDLSDDTDAGRSPVVAVVGRPNVGKSTLVNRILGRREAVVQDIPGVTRDRIAYDAIWSGRRFTLVDTGGWEPDAPGTAGAWCPQQAERAVATADLVVVRDRRTHRRHRDRSGRGPYPCAAARRPVVLTVTKVDDERLESDATELWSLGLGEPYPVSGLHGRGSGDLLDAVLGQAARCPTRDRRRGRPAPGRPDRTAQRGQVQPAQQASRARTAPWWTRLPAPRSTRWTASSTLGGEDVALRRHRGPAPARAIRPSGMEYYASLRTAGRDRGGRGLRSSCSTRPNRLTEQDQRVIAEVTEGGRALVLAFNKWDLLTGSEQGHDRHEVLEREIDRDLARVDVGAAGQRQRASTGRAVDKLAPALRTSLASWDRRIPTGRLNQLAHRRHRRRPRRRPRGGQGAAGAFRHPGRHATTPVRAVHHRVPGGRLPPVHRAASLREDFDFTGSADRGVRTRAGTARQELLTARSMTGHAPGAVCAVVASSAWWSVG